MADGVARFGAAKNDLSTAADRATTAVTTLKARASQSGHLIDATKVNATELTAQIAQFKNALTQQATINGTTYNLNAWFTNPPVSLRALEPTYHVTTQFGTKSLTASATDFPDMTLGGLIVNPTASQYSQSISSYDDVSRLFGLGRILH